MNTILRNLGSTLAISMLVSTGVGCAAQTEQVGEDVATSTDEQALTSFIACRGTGQHVCDEKVDPIYFTRHPSCKPNPGCLGVYAGCWSECPPPAADEVPTAKLKAAGATTTNAQLEIGYTWTSCVPNYCTGGLHSAKVSYGSPWVELTLGAGVNVPANKDVLLMCNNSQSNRRVTGLTVAWTNGQTSSYPCESDWSCRATVPFGTGFTATCNFAAR